MVTLHCFHFLVWYSNLQVVIEEGFIGTFLVVCKMLCLTLGFSLFVYEISNVRCCGPC